MGRKIERTEQGPKDRPGVTSLKRKTEEKNADEKERHENDAGNGGARVKPANTD